MEIKAHPQRNATTAEPAEKKPTGLFKKIASGKKPPVRSRSHKKVGGTIFDLAAQSNTQRPPSDNSSPVHSASVQKKEGSCVAVESSKGSRVTNLSLDLDSLVEKMADYIIIESEKGISTTTVELEMAGTPMEGLKLELTHYDTAPHSFNLQLSGTPEAQRILETHLEVLQSALRERPSLRSFQINVCPPNLYDRSKPSFKRDEKGKKGNKKRVQASGEV